MPFPVDLAPVVAGYDYGIQDPSHCQNGFEYQGVQYLFLMQNGFGTPAGDHKLHALSSSDGGNTWLELDAVNAPNVGTVTAYGNCYTVCRDDATVYALYVRATFHGGSTVTLDGLTVVQFSLAAGTWGTSTDYAAPVLDFMQKNRAGNPSRETQVNLVRRGAGDMIFYYSGPTEISGITGRKLARVYAATFDGSTFGAGTELPDQSGSNLYFFPTGCICDSHGNVHFFYMDGHGGAIGFNVYHVAMDSLGLFGATQVVTDQGYWFDVTGSFSPPVLFTLSHVEQVAFLGVINDDVSSTTQSLRVFYASTSSLVPTWSNSIATQDQAHLPVFFGFFLECLMVGLTAIEGDILYAVWTWASSSSAALADGYIFESHTSLPGLNWTASTQLYEASLSPYPTCQVTVWPIAAGLSIASAAAKSFDDSELGQYYFVAGPAPPPQLAKSQGGAIRHRTRLPAVECTPYVTMMRGALLVEEEESAIYDECPSEEVLAGWFARMFL